MVSGNENARLNTTARSFTSNLYIVFVRKNTLQSLSETNSFVLNFSDNFRPPVILTRFDIGTRSKVKTIAKGRIEDLMISRAHDTCTLGDPPPSRYNVATKTRYLAR